MFQIHWGGGRCIYRRHWFYCFFWFARATGREAGWPGGASLELAAWNTISNHIYPHLCWLRFQITFTLSHSKLYEPLCLRCFKFLLETEVRQKVRK